MVINKGNKILGTFNSITGYMAGDQNIVRSRTSLTGERVKNDPAFEGFRKSGERMKQASAIASELYNRIPKDLKRFSMFRQLTGEALKMMKQGRNREEIVEKLQVLYISTIIEKDSNSTINES